jgi:chromosome segregation protein
MRIKQLKLVGFKSFVEPADLRIEAGLTGIVGPNGCGKSNLLEAIRWVMGENSAKSMRGSGMEDVIFAGTSTRPAREFAEVTIFAERDGDENAPVIIANDEDIEIIRRIERGAGSAYRANGRDVRAKDVSLIFADAATGAHSPALVSQGRIGSIISAKPQERRQMLEEAAGISGLHVRRKDAEQKLRAAETNLNRLATILADMELRASQLRRQAKQAERYKKLSKEITQGEARLIYVRWKEAKAAADAAKAEAAQASAAVDAAAAVQRELTDKQQDAVRALADHRAAAMAARDAASDLSNNIVRMTAERDQLIQRQADIEAQAARIADDGTRESKLTHDAAAALERLQGESETLAVSVKASEEERPALIRTAENAERQVREAEVAFAKASAEQARADAELRVAGAAVETANARLSRAERDVARLVEERAAVGDAGELAKARDDAKASAVENQNALAKLQAGIATAEAARATLIEERDEAQNALASAKADHAALLSERATLERALTAGSGDKAIDRITVKAGYEHALAAALGDDAGAGIGGDAGRRWTGSAYVAPSISTDRLISHVEAPTELASRLAMVVVLDHDDGRALAAGERLVTRDGKMRRWDGFIAEDDGATTAERLIRMNRLAELSGLIPLSEAALAEKANSLEHVVERITGLQEQTRLLAGKQQDADNALRQALREADRTEDVLNRAISAQAALVERSETAEGELLAARTDASAAATALSTLPDSSHHDILVSKLSAENEAVRHLLMRSQADLSSLDQQLAHLRERRAVAMAEIRSWQDRAGEAERRIADMNKRSAEIAHEREAMAGRPDIIAAELMRLEGDRGTIAEKLATLQAQEQQSEAAMRTLEAELATAAEALSSARELRAGAEARAENQESRRIEMGRISGERFECPPPVLPEKLEFSEDELSDAGGESARLDRLQADRERIGPVNLIAADELSTLEVEQEKGIAESSELTEAINRLRGSIGSLNREGRVRLRAAFEAVDQHFQRLFSTLFNGGQAHLALIDSDDPLEAGLEIFAQPPGKKLQSLMLLSGGEQALTAVALIFALFLTNPAPICVLDEVDAPLDDANIERFCDLLDAMTKETDTRYLIVTHNAVTMSRMHRLFGVTMIEQGVSRLVSVDLGGATELLAAE